MPRIINAFRGTDPTTAALARLGQAAFGDQATGALKREKLRTAQRENVETENLSRLVGAQGAHTLGSDPVAQALIIGAGYNPTHFANLALQGAANAYGAEDPRTVNAQIGARLPFTSTATAFRADDATARRGQDIASADRRYGVDQRVAEQARQFDRTPVETMVGGQPAFTPRSDVFVPNEFGDQPQPVLSFAEQRSRLLGDNFNNLGALSSSQREVLKANPSDGSVFNIQTPDGRVHATRDGLNDLEGRPIPNAAQGRRVSLQGGQDELGANLTNSVETDLQKQAIAYRKFNALVDRALPLTQDPTLFGPQGIVRSRAQDVFQAFGGIDGQQAAQQDLAARIGLDKAAAVLPELYDPRLGEVETLWGLIVYQGASALAGQENRSVSDKDVVFMKQILGDPRSFFSSNLSARTKLLQARAIVESFADIADRARTQGLDVPAPSADNRPQQPVVDYRDYFGGQ